MTAARSICTASPAAPDEAELRYLLIVVDVFSQFDDDGHGNYTDLVQKNIDTSMGLDLAVACQDVDSLLMSTPS